MTEVADEIFSALSSSEESGMIPDELSVVPPEIVGNMETKSPFTPQVVEPFTPGIPTSSPFVQSQTVPSPFTQPPAVSTAPLPFVPSFAQPQTSPFSTSVVAPSPFAASFAQPQVASPFTNPSFVQPQVASPFAPSSYSSSSATPHIQVQQPFNAAPSPFAASAVPPSPFAASDAGNFRQGVAAPVFAGGAQPLSPIVFGGAGYNDTKGKTAPKDTPQRISTQQVLKECCNHLGVGDFFKRIVDSIHSEALQSIVSSANDRAVVEGILKNSFGERKHDSPVFNGAPTNVHFGCLALIHYQRQTIQGIISSYCFSFGQAPVIPWTYNTFLYKTSPYKTPTNISFRGEDVGITLVRPFCYSLVMIMNGTTNGRDFVYNDVNISLVDIALTHDMKGDLTSYRTIQMDIEKGDNPLSGQSFVSSYHDVDEYINAIFFFAKEFTKNPGAITSKIKFSTLETVEDRKVMCPVRF